MAADATAPGQTGEAVERQAEIRRRWALAAPAIGVIVAFSLVPLLVMLVYSFLEAGQYGGVILEPSLEGWTSVVMERDLLDDTLQPAVANLTLLGPAVGLAFATTALTMIFGIPTAWFIATQPPQSRSIWSS